MKKILILFIAIIFLTGCNINNIKSIEIAKESDEITVQNEEIIEGINFKDKTLAQILPGFPEDIITLIDKQELSMLSHLYYFPENDFVNMTGDKRDTCYKVEYISVDAEKSFNQYMEMFNAKPGEDPEQFEVKAGNYLIKFRIHQAISTIYINCYTHLDEEYKEAKLDEVVSKYTPSELIKNYLRKEIMILPESKSSVFEFTFDGATEKVKEFYKNIIPDAKEETRNDVVYIEDSVVGTEIAQYITIESKYNTVNVDEVTYQ
ncbi:MAG: lipoprotein [Candidatus Humimicrobiaceae bacterium]